MESKYTNFSAITLPVQLLSQTHGRLPFLWKGDSFQVEATPIVNRPMKNSQDPCLWEKYFANILLNPQQLKKFLTNNGSQNRTLCSQFSQFTKHPHRSNRTLSARSSSGQRNVRFPGPVGHLMEKPPEKQLSGL